MHTYNLNVFGRRFSFKAETEPQRVEKALRILEERHTQLKGQSTELTQERILVFLALTLADDMLEAQEKLEKVEHRLNEFIARLDGNGRPVE